MNLKSKYDIAKVLAATNVGTIIKADDLKTIGQVVVKEFDIDEESRGDWKQANYEANKLALQIPEPKTSPWPGASNIKFPQLTIAAQVFQSRAYPALVNGPDLVKFTNYGDDPDGSRAASGDRIASYMSYQFLEEDENWNEDTDRLTMVLPITGTVIRKSYYNPTTGRVCSEMVMPADFCVSYYTKSLDQCPRCTEILHYSLREIKAKQIAGLYLEVELKEAPENTIDEHVEELQADRGFIEPADDPEKTRPVLEQHRYMDLDGDGYFEPYVVTVDHDSKKVLRIIPRFSETEIKRNTDNQVASLKNQMQQIQSQPMQPGSTEQMQAEQNMRSQTLQALQQEAQRLQKSGKIVYIEPIQYFTKYSFLPSPDGSFYDIGFGTLLSPINHAVNTILNQLVDSGTLQNSSLGFISANVRLRGNDYRFRPFEWKRAEVGAGSLKEGLVPLPISPPSPVLFQLLELLISYSDKLTSVTEMMLGETPGQNTPAQVSMAALDQGMKVYSGIMKRLYRAQKQEFRKVYRLNRLYLDPQKYFIVLGTQNQGVVYQQDFLGDPREISPEADPNMVSDSMRIQRAMFLAGRSATVPGYNTQAVELRLLKDFKVMDINEIYPTNPPIQPPPNPELQLEVMELKRKMTETQGKLQIQGYEAIARVENLRAQALQFIAQAKALGPELELKKAEHMLETFDTVHGAISDLIGHKNDAEANNIVRQKAATSNAGTDGGAG